MIKKINLFKKKDSDNEFLSVLREKKLKDNPNNINEKDLIECGPSSGGKNDCEIDENSSSDKENSDNNFTSLGVDTFVLIKIPIQNSSNYKYYAAKIIHRNNDDGEASPYYTVRFLRKKGEKDTYFYFPAVPDESVVEKFDILQILKPVPMRRERYKFSNMPKKSVE
ncbi:unnamed protein product [Brassicogethes aeneus]|uniref:Uncharacterized protein n=1 Tax=Brassicogethes aeneus TaxID=1431903 RepID=A0A9P0BAF1_BRAAE|nr:unnamed protein product [Brassicogethes aeneus]